MPVSFASLQYLSFRMNAAALGCLCLVKIPFLFPTTRVMAVDTMHMQQGVKTQEAFVELVCRFNFIKLNSTSASCCKYLLSVNDFFVFAHSFCFDLCDCFYF